MKKRFLLTYFVLFCLTISMTAQTPELPNNRNCKVSLDMQSTDSVFIKERKELEIFTKEFATKEMQGGNCYVIPVVFHVYGTTQGGMPVNDAIIIDALDKVNQDFHGLNADFNSVHNNFLAIRGTMPDVVFALAQKDPGGNPTTGIDYHPVTAGYANGSGYDLAIAADAWDNYKYMNIYVMNDLFNDAVTTNSGYAYYPSTSMSNNNTARIVYNGAYLGINCTWEPEFASTLSHEFGHWLNLIHTFDGGCANPNDNVADTPPCDYLGSSYLCHASASSNSPLNCNSNLINAENYMDYCGGQDGCYKMFTQGQATRMYAALQVPSRQPLWQFSNLVATGLDHLCSSSGISPIENGHIQLYPNPSNGLIYIEFDDLSLENELVVEVQDLLGKIVRRYTIKENSSKKIGIDLSEHQAGIYFVNIHLKEGTQTYPLILQ